MIYRCKYTKLGDMCFIAHLDLLRIFIRSLRRASIQINYSQGFNPHAKISFSPALGLGIESLAEIIDIDTSEEASAEEIKERFNAALPEGIEIISCEVLEKAGSIPALMNHSLYEYQFSAITEEILKSVDTIKDLDEIIILKKNKKKKEIATDVKNRINDIYAKGNKVYAMLLNSTDGALKPVELLEILSQYANSNLESLKITKIDSYFIDEEGKRLV